MASRATRDALLFPLGYRSTLDAYLPPLESSSSSLPHTTLTFAASLDGAISLSPGTQTALSGPLSKAMTHYLRSRHDAILIGVTTALCDNPSLNCRLDGVGGYGCSGLDRQPRPVIIDPSLRWQFEEGNCKILCLTREGRGRAPYIVTGVIEKDIPIEKKAFIEAAGGQIICLPIDKDGRMSWQTILCTLRQRGMHSVMIEGGAGVINSLLTEENEGLVDSVVVTMAPTWLGQGAVVVSPAGRVQAGHGKIPAVKLRHVKWVPMEEDVVLCSRLR